MPFRLFGDAWRFLRKLEELFELHSEMRQTFELMASRMEHLEARITRMEADRAGLLVEVRAATTGVATSMAVSVLSDAITRITRLEDRVALADRHRSSNDQS